LRRKLIALKSSQHFRSGFESLADAIITTDAPGITTAKIDTFPRSRCPRPMFPLDSDARYNEERPPRTVARG
jgi:microcystin degradation protein MlrC